MLVLRRKDGEWITIIHQGSGDVLRIKAYAITPGKLVEDPTGQLPPKKEPNRVSLAFVDDDHNFQIERDERTQSP